MRLGLFGGSFDPPHVGHLLVAQDALAALRLDRLLVIPAAQQPLKDQHATSATHRLAMARACFAGVSGIEVDSVEIERGGLSYMVDTVEAVHRRWPAAELHLLVGRDVLPTLPRWHDVDRLLRMVHLVVFTRETAPDTRPLPINEETHSGIVAEYLATRRVDISSTEVRSRVRDGRSIRGFVPDAVAAYIASTGLYLEHPREPIDAECIARA